MLANSTTLVVGAGASVPLGYPTGAELRDWIIDGRGMDDWDDSESERDRKRLNWRLARSLIPSIDAFLAEDENEDLRGWGVLCIAGALLPCEALKKGRPPAWLQMVFNVIRGRQDEDHKHPLRIVTFNYDLSIEYFLFHAFLASYKLSEKDARTMMDQSVQVIHVYGQLGQIVELGGDREYGGEITKSAVSVASKGLKIIGRAPDDPIFNEAHQAIVDAEFLGILGFGYDATNVANLKLYERVAPKYAFSTGFGMGYGMRAWMRNSALPPITIGSSKDDVAAFLHIRDFSNGPIRLGRRHLI
jgi:hypothetical protein